MNQPVSADALETSAYEDDFGDALEDQDAGGAEGAAQDWDGAGDVVSFEEQDGQAADAFEAHVADALDAAEADEFMGRLLAALPRPAQGAAVQPSPAAVLQEFAGEGADEQQAFDAAADAYEQGVDEALPAVIGLAARGLARGLGHRNVRQLGQAARRALVRGVATAARTLVDRHGPRGARALGRLAEMTGGAARRAANHPQQAAQRAASVLPRAAERIAQQAATVQRLARPLVATTRVLRLRGPVEIVIRQR